MLGLSGTLCISVHSSAVKSVGVGWALPGVTHGCLCFGAWARYSAVIDWGYANNNAYPVDLCLNALLLSSLQALVSWVAAVDPASVEKCVKCNDAIVMFELQCELELWLCAFARYEQARDGQMQLLQTYLGMPQSVLCSQVLIRREGATTGIMSNRMARNATSLPFDPTKLGMHAAGLLLRAGVFDGPKNITARTACCAYIKVRSLFVRLGVHVLSWCLGNPMMRCV